ncbi:MAG: hypothetical protein FWG84_04230 [Bacteroidales bacterium]|nr:hypothetical protein [Bacteroidales bacterium]
MTTMIVSIKKNADIRHIATAVSQLKGVAQVKMQNETAFERISGLPYTHEERLLDIYMAEEDIRSGRVYSTEEVRTMFPIS